MKPLGLALDAVTGYRITRSSRVEDKIWEAVEEAISANMTPEQFRAEAGEAWEHALREDAKHAREVLR